MAAIYPFRAFRPRRDVAPQVASVPYDVVSRDEAKALARSAHSFLHVTRPEIDLDPTVDPKSLYVYACGAAYLQQMIADGILYREKKPALFVYALTMDGRTQTGVTHLASVAEYNRNEVKKHELTRPDKEDDRVAHMEVLAAQTGIVFLVHKDSNAIAELVHTVTQSSPETEFVAEDAVKHQVWRVPADLQNRFITAFHDAGSLYIADGHHRSAAAARVAMGGKFSRAEHGDGFLAVSFPQSQLQILPYNRVVKDLNGKSSTAFLDALGEKFRVVAVKPTKLERHRFGMYLQGVWHTLTPHEHLVDENNPLARLDVNILQEHVLAPILGVDDPRTNTRIDFIGGIRGDDALEKRVNSGWAVAFKLHATSIDDLMAIADAGEIMPPKSTWFEPKLRDGLFVYSLASTDKT